MAAKPGLLPTLTAIKSTCIINTRDMSLTGCHDETSLKWLREPAPRPAAQVLSTPYREQNDVLRSLSVSIIKTS